MEKKIISEDGTGRIGSRSLLPNLYPEEIGRKKADIREGLLLLYPGMF